MFYTSPQQAMAWGHHPGNLRPGMQTAKFSVRSFCLLLPLAAMLVLSACGGGEPQVRRMPPKQPPPPLVPDYQAPQNEAPIIVRPDPTRQSLPQAQMLGSGAIRIALMVPLSGQHAALGEALLNAAQMALFDAQHPRLVLVPIDTKGTPNGALEAMTKARAADANLVLGPVFADSIRAIRPDAMRYGTTIIGFSSDRSVAGAGIYTMGFTPEHQVRQIVDHAVAQGRAQFTALIPQTLFGERMLEAYVDALAWHQLEPVQVEYYVEDTDALEDPVKRLANYDARRTALLEEVAYLESFGEDDLTEEMLESLKNVETLGKLTFDIVFLPAGGHMVRNLAPLLPFYEIDPVEVQFLGTGQWDDPGLRFEPALLGARFAGPLPEAGKQFAARYASVYNSQPPRIASLAYDATALAATLIRLNNRRPFSHEALMNPRGYAGLDGVFRFQADGTAERRLSIIEINSDGLALAEGTRPPLEDKAIPSIIPRLMEHYSEEEEPDDPESLPPIEVDDGLEAEWDLDFAPGFSN